MTKKYQVLRTFPDKRVLSRSAIVTDPEWRNIPQLIRNGYIKEIEEENKSEISIETPVETAPVMNEAEITEPAVIDETPSEVTEVIEKSTVETDTQTQSAAETEISENAAEESAVTVPVVQQPTVQDPVESKMSTAKAKSKKKK